MFYFYVVEQLQEKTGQPVYVKIFSEDTQLISMTFCKKKTLCVNVILRKPDTLNCYVGHSVYQVC